MLFRSSLPSTAYRATTLCMVVETFPIHKEQTLPLNIAIHRQQGYNAIHGMKTIATHKKQTLPLTIAILLGAIAAIAAVSRVLSRFSSTWTNLAVERPPEPGTL